MYCKEGQKPKITYQFTGQSEKVFISQFSPIDVITKSAPVDATANYMAGGFNLYFYSPNNARFLNIVILDYYIVDGYYLWIKQCNSTVFILYTGISPGTIIINPNIKCGTPTNKKSSIQVVYNDLVIFTDQADGGVSFSVQCGNCPEGFCECASPVYPGYCCLDCAATAANIRSITNDLKGKNG